MHSKSDKKKFVIYDNAGEAIDAFSNSLTS